MDLYNLHMSQTSMVGLELENESECTCECQLGHTCKVCRTDLVVLLVNVGVPLRTASRFVQLEVGVTEVEA